MAGCRPIVGMDGCHLKGRFRGHILSAIARDENDNIFLVAMAIVEQEILIPGNGFCNFQRKILENLRSWNWYLFMINRRYQCKLAI